LYLKREVAGGWRDPHNEELHNLYAASNIIKVIKSRIMRWVGHVARIGQMRNAYSILVGKPEGKRPFGRPNAYIYIYIYIYMSLCFN